MGHVNGGVSNHALVRRFARLGASIATAATLLVIVAGNATASPAAQFDFRALICSILASLAAAFGRLGSLFGGFFAGFFSQLLAAFGCGGVSG